MKRSEINAVIRDAMQFAHSKGYTFPPFGYWTPEDWATKGHAYDEIRENMLGWDITDWGMNDFRNWGLVLFTARNGNLKKEDNRKLYAEKLLIVRDKQKEPYHYHWNKVEDIINRGGGTLYIKLYNAGADDGLADTEVKVSRDGKLSMEPAGVEIALAPGESLTIFTKQYHMMWADGDVLAGEVSNTNDDNNDNRFLEDNGRFPGIEADEAPAYLLCNEYPAHNSAIMAGRRIGRAQITRMIDA